MNIFSKQNLNLQPISNPNTTGNVISVPLINHNLSSNNGNLAFNNKKKVAIKLIAHFFSPLRALSTEPIFTFGEDNGFKATFNKDTNINSEYTLCSSNNQNTTSTPNVTKRSDFLKDKDLMEYTYQSKQKLVINSFYYVNNNSQALSNTAINKLGYVLSKLFGQPVELRLVRLHYPYLNSYILAQYVAINTKKYNFTRIQRAIFGSLLLPKPKSIASEFLIELEKNNSTNNLLIDRLIPSHITGIMIRLSGRLKTQRSIPRQTVQVAQIGTFSPSKGMKNVIEFASFTDKNKKGAFTVKVWISQLTSLTNH